MDSTRAAGIILHVTSLPGPHGNGDLGAEAHDFVNSLIRAGQGIWQVLPLGPTGYGDSPYQSFSAFAGNPLLVDLRELAAQGWLTNAELAEAPAFPPDIVDYERVIPWRMAQLRRAFARFRESPSPLSPGPQAGPGPAGTGRPARGPGLSDFDAFCKTNADWLSDFALFLAIKREQGEVEWTRWPAELAAREPATLKQARQRLAGEIEFHQFVQWCFFRQWQALKRHSNSAGVRIVGDVPIFVAHDSADVWVHRELFKLDEAGRPLVVAGVPPDYFSATGQLWGNPLYDWDRLAVRGYDWWIRRLRQATALFDLVRLDHFRGFVAHWEIPADSATAASGHWMPGPASSLFAAATAALGPLPLIAEDLGVITPAVVALREEFGYPGMRILQFAFGDDPEAPNYLPHNYVPQTVVYTGTHDNDTAVGWFHSEAGEGTTRTAQQIARERAHTLAYVNTSGVEIHWDLIRLAAASVARLAIYPLQDVLGLGAAARMNMPSTTSGNWCWRCAPGQFTAEHEQRLHSLAETFDRQLFAAPREGA